MISCGITAFHSRFGPLITNLDPPTKTLLLPNSRSRTRNKCKLMFTFWNGHALPIFLCNVKGSYFLSQALGHLRFSTKRSPRGKSVVFCKPLFLCLETVIPLLKNLCSHSRLLVLLFSFFFFSFLLSLRPVRRVDFLHDKLGENKVKSLCLRRAINRDRISFLFFSSILFPFPFRFLSLYPGLRICSLVSVSYTIPKENGGRQGITGESERIPRTTSAGTLLKH